MPSGKDSLRTKKQPAPTKTQLRMARAKVPITHAGNQFGYKHQIFIAKLKRGEVWALNHLSFQAKTATTPLFEICPPKPATATTPAKTLSQHTTDLIQLLASEWTNLPAYLDTKYLQGGGAPSPAAVQTVFGIARTMNVSVVPVTSPFFSQAFQQAIHSVVASDGRGVMFRLPVSFFNDIQNIGGYLDGLATAVGVNKDSVDILIDLEHRTNVAEVQQMGAYCLTNLPSINDWRTVTLASGCFPSSITGEPTGTWISFNRADWNGWSAIAGQRKMTHLRVPSYGDYGVRCGGEPLFIPNSPAPNIRYTDTQTIWVRKEQKTPGTMQTICADLISKAYFRGASFSQGDAQIAQKATTTSQANGSPEQWIQWCTNHHLELTAWQIQNLP